ncbi:MAG TPA: hypothetical protein ENN79_04915, partial [Desulfobacteraceae bacterium]|nr:hypothetical protein [Desulfobacteraceae bacterium]
MAQRENHPTGTGKKDETFYLKIYFPDPNGLADPYSEENSTKMVLIPDEWNQINVTVPDPAALRVAGLRIDPFNTRGFVSISGMRLVNRATGSPCWVSGKEEEGFSEGKDALLLADGD